MYNGDMKRCIICGETKPLAQFHKNKSRADGHTNRCKPCACSYVSKHTLETGYYKQRAYLDRKYAYVLSTWNKVLARQAVYRAVKSGQMKRERCKECKAASVQAHHHNGYEKKDWLNVIWLCHKHHAAAHHG